MKLFAFLFAYNKHFLMAGLIINQTFDFNLLMDYKYINK